MGINAGAFLTLCGWLGYEYWTDYGFGAAGIGMIAFDFYSSLKEWKMEYLEQMEISLKFTSIKKCTYERGFTLHSSWPYFSFLAKEIPWRSDRFQLHSSILSLYRHYYFVNNFQKIPKSQSRNISLHKHFILTLLITVGPLRIGGTVITLFVERNVNLTLMNALRPMRLIQGISFSWLSHFRWWGIYLKRKEIRLFLLNSLGILQLDWDSLSLWWVHNL